VRGREIELAVAVQITARERDGLPSGCVVEPRFETPIPAIHEHRNAVPAVVEIREVRPAVAVEIRDRDGIGETPGREVTPGLEAAPAAVREHRNRASPQVLTRGVHKLDLHAAASYSWSSPPRRSRRRT
jgi:hypothetical protein